MPDGRVDFHSIDPKSTVAIDRDHLPFRHSKCGSNREGHTDSKASECTGIHIGICAKSGSGKAEQVATIGDCNVVRIGHCGDCIEDHCRMDFPIGPGRRTILEASCGIQTFKMTAP